MTTKNIFIIATIVITAAACSTNETKTPQQAVSRIKGASDTSSQAKEEVIELTPQQLSKIDLSVVPITNGSVNEIIKVNGTVESPTELRHNISFPFGGYLKSTTLVPGQHVAKGSIMATMEDAIFIQLQQDYLLSKSKLSFLQADFERQQELSRTQSSSQRTFQQAKTDLENEQITVVALAEKLRLIGINPETLSSKNLSRSVNIYAPINGYISRVNTNPGKYVAPTDVLFEVIDPSKIHISLTVFEANSSSLRIGQKISYVTNQGNAQKGTATIEYISPAINESRAVEVHCHIDPPVSRLIPGTFITAEISIASQSGKTVPSDAIVSHLNQQYIFIQDEPLKFRLMPVSIGESSKGLTVIISALPADKPVVTNNAYTLLTMLKNTQDE